VGGELLPKQKLSSKTSRRRESGSGDGRKLGKRVVVGGMMIKGGCLRLCWRSIGIGVPVI
jgi:hypothetical protein